MYISNVSENDFNAYMEECKNYGFSLKSYIGEESYEAYNESGVKLTLILQGHLKEMTICTFLR